MAIRYFFLLCLTICPIAGCDGQEARSDPRPMLGVLELPISHRLSGPEPRDATRVEIGTGEVRIEGVPVLTLQNGRVPASEVQGSVLTRLKAGLGSKRVLAISIHAAVPYSTLFQVMHTGLTSGAREVAFRARKPGSHSETGWLAVRHSHFVDSADQANFATGDLLPWTAFTRVWEDAVDACHLSQRADCGYKPLAKAEGGHLDLMLRARGAGLALRFRQAGVPPPGDVPKPVSKAADMLDGVPAAPAAVEELPPEPSREHVFTLRADQATVSPSPVSGVMGIVCGGHVCPAVVDAEPNGMSGRVLSLIGASFPDGSPELRLAWVRPR